MEVGRTMFPVGHPVLEETNRAYKMLRKKMEAEGKEGIASVTCDKARKGFHGLSFNLFTETVSCLMQPENRQSGSY